MKNVKLFWRDRTHPAPDMRLLARIAQSALEHRMHDVREKTFLQINFVSSAVMTRVNDDVLGHVGDTDVITLDYRWDAARDGADLFALPLAEPEPFGELFICPAVAQRQLMHYSGRTYPREIVTYIVHGILHLCGEDDLEREKRIRMKRKERADVVSLAAKYDFSALFESKVSII